jgi:dephospho-CoA kinase
MSGSYFGVVGPIASGKDELARILESKGYLVISLSDRIREEIVKRGNGHLVNDRQTLQDVADELRERKRADILALRSLEKIGKAEKVVFTSIRNPDEIKTLKTFLPIAIISVDASQERRFSFLKRRKRGGDPTTWEEFLEKDGREFREDAEDFRIKVRECMEMADVKIVNNGTKGELRSELERVLSSFGQAHEGKERI